MNNPFKNIIQNEKLPSTLKEKVLSDVALIKLAIDLSELKIIKYPKTVGKLLNLNKDK